MFDIPDESIADDGGVGKEHAREDVSANSVFHICVIRAVISVDSSSAILSLACTSLSASRRTERGDRVGVETCRGEEEGERERKEDERGGLNWLRDSLVCRSSRSWSKARWSRSDHIVDSRIIAQML